MKKFIAALLMFVFINVAYQTQTLAQTPTATDPSTTTVTDPNATTVTPPVIDEPKTSEVKPPAPVAQRSAHQTIKKYFIDGGWDFMSIVMITLILGLALAIERIITLSLATINTKKLMNTLSQSIESGDFAGAAAICKATPGPTAEVLGAGLLRVEDGVDSVEKTIVSHASVQVGLLEKGLVWLSLFIALAPMLGFMGTVVGMIQAFDTIEASNDIRPSEVAGGIKVALLTTVFGLIVAMILQVFYNYITSKVDAIVNGMEDATNSMVSILIENGYANGVKK
jgi:biopolymer transport protein ExbB